jgi:glycine/D-amino acid oxidase-like deaminating enzyme
MASDVIIVGAGMVGAACAWSLARRGVRVSVVGERLAGGATAAGMGHLLVVDDDPHMLDWTRQGRSGWERIAREWGAEDRARIEWSESGTLWVAETAEDVADAHAKRERMTAAGVDCAWIDAKALGDLEPSLSPALLGALRVPGDRIVYPPAAAQWLLEDAQRHGAQLRLGQRVERVADRLVFLAGGEQLEGDRVIVAAGQASGRLLGIGGLEVVPKKGHLVITERVDLSVRHHLVELGYARSVANAAGWSVAFNVQPRPTGQLLVGSSRSYEGGRRLDRAIVAAMLRRAFEFMPALASAPALRTWTGLRPMAGEGAPLIGPAGDSDSAPLVATGHEGLGVTTALVTADSIAAWLGLGEHPVDPRPFDPRRAVAQMRSVHHG